MLKPGQINEWLARIAWGSITLVSGYAATQLSSLSSSVNTLNTNVAVVVQQITTQKEETADLKSSADMDRKILADHEKRVTASETAWKFLNERVDRQGTQIKENSTKIESFLLRVKR